MRFFIGGLGYLNALAALWVAVALIGKVDGQNADKNEADRCFLWKVSSKTSSVYLLGSMHMTKKDFFPLAKEIEDAFAGSRALVVEVDPDALDQTKMQKMVLQKGLYPAGETLSKNLSKATTNALKNYCVKKGMKVEALEPFRPWVVYLLVAVGELKALGLSEDGIDKYFLKKAKAEKKPIVELETADAQLQLFTELAPDLQEKLLAMTLSDVDEFKDRTEKMIAAWQSGDAKAMDDIMLRGTIKRHPDIKGVMVKTFDDRNVKMVEKIEDMLRGKDTIFVVVGAGHIVGEKGIVKLLEDKKYQVEQVRRTAAKKAS